MKQNNRKIPLVNSSGASTSQPTASTSQDDVRFGIVELNKSWPMKNLT